MSENVKYRMLTTPAEAMEAVREGLEVEIGLGDNWLPVRRDATLTDFNGWMKCAFHFRARVVEGEGGSFEDSVDLPSQPWSPTPQPSLGELLDRAHSVLESAQPSRLTDADLSLLADLVEDHGSLTERDALNRLRDRLTPPQPSPVQDKSGPNGWEAVMRALDKCEPTWRFGGGPLRGLAVEAINRLAARAAEVPSPVQGDGGLAEIVAFLNGTGPLDGVQFGEKHPTRPGPYWWRSLVIPALAATQPGGGDGAMLERLEDKGVLFTTIVGAAVQFSDGEGYEDTLAPAEVRALAADLIALADAAAAPKQSQEGG